MEKLPISKFQSGGFALLEMLVVLSIFGLVVALASQIFFSALRGTVKTEALTRVKQNGNYALSVMQRALRNSKGNIECSDQSVTYSDALGNRTSFSCLGAGGSDGYIASGSARLTGSDVRVSSCVITCAPAILPREVEISITLEGKDSFRAEEKVSLPFYTRVTLRN